MVIQETARVTFTEDAEGRSIMSLKPALNFDVGIYKVVARNKGGQTVARFRWDNLKLSWAIFGLGQINRERKRTEAKSLDWGTEK